MTAQLEIECDILDICPDCCGGAAAMMAKLEIVCVTCWMLALTCGRAAAMTDQLVVRVTHGLLVLTCGRTAAMTDQLEIVFDI